jgi:hypothetical protein
MLLMYTEACMQLYSPGQQVSGLSHGTRLRVPGCRSQASFSAMCLNPAAMRRLLASSTAW